MVVLPPPDAPMSAVTLPRGTVREMSSRTNTFPVAEAQMAAFDERREFGMEIGIGVGHPQGSAGADPALR